MTSSFIVSYLRGAFDVDKVAKFFSKYKSIMYNKILIDKIVVLSQSTSGWHGSVHFGLQWRERNHICTSNVLIKMFRNNK